MDELDDNLKRIRNAVEAKIATERQRLAPKVAGAPTARSQNGLASRASVPSTSPVEAASASDASQHPKYDDDVQAPAPIEAGQEGCSVDYNVADDDQSHGKHRSVEHSEGTPETRDPSETPTGDLPNRAGQQTEGHDANSSSGDVREPSTDIAVSEPSIWSKFKKFVGLE